MQVAFAVDMHLPEWRLLACPIQARTGTSPHVRDVRYLRHRVESRYTGPGTNIDDGVHYLGG